jgi:hypothetical protein
MNLSKLRDFKPEIAVPNILQAVRKLSLEGFPSVECEGWSRRILLQWAPRPCGAIDRHASSIDPANGAIGCCLRRLLPVVPIVSLRLPPGRGVLRADLRTARLCGGLPPGQPLSRMVAVPFPRSGPARLKDSPLGAPV